MWLYKIIEHVYSILKILKIDDFHLISSIITKHQGHQRNVLARFHGT